MCDALDYANHGAGSNALGFPTTVSPMLDTRVRCAAVAVSCVLWLGDHACVYNLKC